MPRARKKTGKKSTARSRNGVRQGSAIALLTADHREVERWFEQFQKARSAERKQTLAENICAALRVHMTIEEEIFYPAFLEATEDESLHHEAEIEHDGARKLIGEIEKSDPSDEYYDSRVKVLSEMIKHHINEEEKRDGMFARAKRSDMDLEDLGQRLDARKKELKQEFTSRAKVGNTDVDMRQQEGRESAAGP